MTSDQRTVTYVGHASAALTIDGVTVLTDPVLTGRVKHLRRMVAPSVFDPSTVDIVLISHQHHDHMHLRSIRRLPRSCHVVVPRGLGSRLARVGFKNVHELVSSESVVIGPTTITAVPAVHDDRRHPGADRVKPVGYLFAIGTYTVYFPGDTSIYSEMADLSPSIDLALMPVWGWGPTLGQGHLDPIEAANALELLDAQAALPIHWGTLWPLHVRPNDRLVLPPSEFADAVRERCLGTNVLSLAPGAATKL